MRSGVQAVADRFYDPTTGSFTSRDPLNAMTRSAYGYVYGNTLNMTDPSGLCGLWGDDSCIGNAADGVMHEFKQHTGVCGAYDLGCQTVAEQHPEATQHVVDVAGGVLQANPITAPLGLNLSGHGVNTQSV